MSGPIVVDVGNSRLKWGLCSSAQVWSTASLPPDDPDAWQNQWREWKLERAWSWTVAGVDPGRRDAFVAWLKEQFGVEVVTLGVRDIILPGEMKELMNKVVEAKKFLVAVTGGEQRNSTIEEALADAEVIAAAAASAVDGQWHQVPQVRGATFGHSRQPAVSHA